MKQNRVKDSTHYKNKVTKEEDGVGKAYWNQIYGSKLNLC